MSAPNKVRNTDYIKNTINFAAVSAATFCVSNTAFNYLKLYKEKTEMLKAGTQVPADWFNFQVKFLWTQTSLAFIPTLALSAFAGLLIANKLSEKRQRTEGVKDIKGDAAWATKKEMLDDAALEIINFSKLAKEKNAGIPIARWGKKYLIDTSTTHSLTIGCTRSGKTQALVLYMIYIFVSVENKQNIVVNDPKGELLESTYRFLASSGYEISILNLRDTSLSSGYNPLTIIINGYVKAMQTEEQDLSGVNNDIDALAGAITFNKESDPIWPGSAKSLLSAMILYLLEACYITNNLDKLSMYAIRTFFVEYGNTGNDYKDEEGKEHNKLDDLFQELPAGHPAKSAYATSQFSKGEARGSVFFTLSDNLSAWTDEGICRLTASNDIDFNTILASDKPQAIFMVIPDDRKNRHTIATLFINQLYQSMVDYLKQKKMKAMIRRWNFILDEFANMVKIPDMDSKMTVSAGRNILFHLFIQSFQQLDDIYAKSSATIRESCGNLIYVYSMSNETNKYFSELLSDQTAEYKTYSGTLSEHMKNCSQQFEGKALMTPDELRRMQLGEIIVVRARLRPVFTQFSFFYKLAFRDTEINDIPITVQRKCKLSDLLLDMSYLVQEEKKYITEKNNDSLKVSEAKKREKVQVTVEDLFFDYNFELQNKAIKESGHDAEPEENVRTQVQSFQPQLKAATSRNDNVKAEQPTLKKSVDAADRFSDGEFTELLQEQKYIECKKLINRISIRDPEFKLAHADRLCEYLNSKKEQQ